MLIKDWRLVRFGIGNGFWKYNKGSRLPHFEGAFGWFWYFGFGIFWYFWGNWGTKICFGKTSSCLQNLQQFIQCSHQSKKDGLKSMDPAVVCFVPTSTRLNLTTCFLGEEIPKKQRRVRGPKSAVVLQATARQQQVGFLMLFEALNPSRSMVEFHRKYAFAVGNDYFCWRANRTWKCWGNQTQQEQFFA